MRPCAMLSHRIPAEIDRAIENREPMPGCIHHSDRGVQYAPRTMSKSLNFTNFKSVWDAKQTPLLMHMLESFIKILKSEQVHLCAYRTLEDAQRRISFLLKMSAITSGFISRLPTVLRMNMSFYLESILTPAPDTLIRLIWFV